MSIQGKVITLRAIELEDLELLARWSNSSEIWHWLGGWHFPYSRVSTEKYIMSLQNSNMQNQIFGIEAEGLGLIGTTSLTNIDWKNSNATSGIMLGNRNVRGKGYALDVITTIMRYAFKELGLNRLDADMIAYNYRSIELYTRKCGWVIEGKREAWFYRNGEFHDKVICGITHEQYDEHVKKTEYWNK